MLKEIKLQSIFICNDAAAFQASSFYFIMCNPSLKNCERIHLAINDNHLEYKRVDKGL